MATHFFYIVCFKLRIFNPLLFWNQISNQWVKLSFIGPEWEIRNLDPHHKCVRKLKVYRMWRKEWENNVSTRMCKEWDLMECEKTRSWAGSVPCLHLVYCESDLRIKVDKRQKLWAEYENTRKEFKLVTDLRIWSPSLSSWPWSTQPLPCSASPAALSVC